MAHHYRTRIASDVIRDGLGVELLSETGEVVAEVFRSDRDRKVIVSTFSWDIPLQAIEQLIVHARERLEPFSDGVPLSNSIIAAPQRIKILGQP